MFNKFWAIPRYLNFLISNFISFISISYPHKLSLLKVKNIKNPFA